VGNGKRAESDADENAPCRNASKQLPDVLYMLFLLTVRARLMIGEILPLEWADVDFRGCVVKPKGKTVYFLCPMV
jgi:integrase